VGNGSGLIPAEPPMLVPGRVHLTLRPGAPSVLALIALHRRCTIDEAIEFLAELAIAKPQYQEAQLCPPPGRTP
jgi:hypothetical protein